MFRGAAHFHSCPARLLRAGGCWPGGGCVRALLLGLGSRIGAASVQLRPAPSVEVLWYSTPRDVLNTCAPPARLSTCKATQKG